MSDQSIPIESNYRLPNDTTLKHAAKISIVEDKPIMLDYWTISLDKKALIGAKENGEKLLVRSDEEYTSTITKFYKSVNDYIIITDNKKRKKAFYNLDELIKYLDSFKMSFLPDNFSYELKKNKGKK